MKNILLTFAISAVSTASSAQKHAKAMYAELGGIGLPYSFAYDVRLEPNTNAGVGLRTGIGGLAIEDEKILTVPLQVNWLLGKDRNFFGLGIGATYLYYEGYDYHDYTWDNNGNIIQDKSYAGHLVLPVSTSHSVMGSLQFGYRRMPVGSGFTWKAALTPVFNNNGFWPLFGGIGVGYKF